MARDPRFDDLSGSFNETYFKQAYGFMSDVKQREKQVSLIDQSDYCYLGHPSGVNIIIGVVCVFRNYIAIVYGC